jgi:hypothetical protein
MSDGLKVVRLKGEAREASGLLTVASRALLGARGWDAAFWTVLDEGPVEQATVLIGRSDGDWTLEHPDFAAQVRKTADGEALARHGEHVYVFGSHFGGKDGLESKRAFAARFREEDLVSRDAEPVALEVWHDDFALHRSVNDALARDGVKLLPIRNEAREQFIGQAIKAGYDGRIREDDVPLNIEGIAFRPDGNLLLGLRCPATEDGHPIVVELPGYAQRFGADLPPVSGVWTLEAVHAEDAAVGIRDLEAEPDGVTLSLIAGGLDKEVLRKKDRRNAGFAHWQATIPARQDDSPVPCRFVRELPEDVERIEGVARDPDGGYVYLSDDEKRVVLLVGG